MDLTPIEVRKKKGDFRTVMRGYDRDAVDNFLDEVAARMDKLVLEHASLTARVAGMGEAIAEYRERERAMNEALVSAQQLREDTREQAAREADLVLREARAEGERIINDAKRQVGLALEALRRIQGQRVRFLRLFRALVERQLTEIEQEEERTAALTRLEAEVDRPPADAAAAPGAWEDEGQNGEGS
ncbi:MAG TPA: DivIVA domain-containing protein [Longimicrobiaceae bacterium]|nr:DivIVA domain-containing protein [Longimicrobiaceae bacterium]